MIYHFGWLAQCLTLALCTTASAYRGSQTPDRCANTLLTMREGVGHPDGLGGGVAQVLYHVWREHTPLWNEMLAEVYVRMGAPTDGPPANLPHRILVRWRLLWALTCTPSDAFPDCVSAVCQLMTQTRGRGHVGIRHGANCVRTNTRVFCH